MDTFAASRDDASAAATGALGPTIAVALVAFASAVVLSVASPSAPMPRVEIGPALAALPSLPSTFANAPCRAERAIRSDVPAARYGRGRRA